MKFTGTITIVSLLLAAGCSHHERLASNEYSPGYSGGSYSSSDTSSGSTSGDRSLNQYSQSSRSSYQPSASSSGSYNSGSANYSSTTLQGGETDAALTTQIRQQISSDPSFMTIAPNLQVTVENGTVTLGGNVPNDQDKRRIESLVRRTSGVTTINNQLQISTQTSQGGATSPGGSATSSSSSESTDQNKSSESSSSSPQSSLNGSSTGATTEGAANSEPAVGTSTSSSQGASQSEASGQSSGQSSSDQSQSSTLQGSQGGTSDTTGTSSGASSSSASPESRAYPSSQFSNIQATSDTDRSLGRQIIRELRTDTTMTSILPNIRLNIDSGKVTLTGTVSSEEQKRTIETSVQKVPGVTSVDNQLTVGSSSTGSSQSQ